MEETMAAKAKKKPAAKKAPAKKPAAKKAAKRKQLRALLVLKSIQARG